MNPRKSSTKPINRNLQSLATRQWITMITSIALLASFIWLFMNIRSSIIVDDTISRVLMTPSDPQKTYTTIPPETSSMINSLLDSIQLYERKLIDLTDNPEQVTLQVKYDHWKEKLDIYRKLEDYQLRLKLHKDDPDFDSEPF